MQTSQHQNVIDNLFSLYPNLGEQHYKELRKFYCDPAANHNNLLMGLSNADHADDDDNYGKIMQVKILGGKPTLTNLIINSLDAFNDNSVSKMLCSQYHFYRWYDRQGVCMSEDPEFMTLAKAASALDPITMISTIIEQLLTFCPFCLGTGSAWWTGPWGVFYDCPICGGDGHILEDIVHEIVEIIGWTSGCTIQTYFGIYPDLISHRFESARKIFSMYYSKAILDYILGRKEAAFIQLGYAIHCLQDITTVPHHVLGLWMGGGHSDYEDGIATSHAFESVTPTMFKSRWKSLSAYIQDAPGDKTDALFDYLSVKQATKLFTSPGQNAQNTAGWLMAAQHYVLEGFYNIANMEFKSGQYKILKGIDQKRALIGSKKYNTLLKKVKIETVPFHDPQLQKLCEAETKLYWRQVKGWNAHKEKWPQLPQSMKKYKKIISKKQINWESLM